MAAHKVWKGHLSFGLLSIPIHLCVGARDKRVEMRNFHVACRTPVNAPKYCGTCKVMLEKTEMFRGFQQGDVIIPVTDAELESIEPATSHVMEISEAVPLADLDPLFLGESFYVLPSEGGEKAYSLLAKALSETKRAAIAQLTKSSRENVVAIRPYKNGMVLQYLWFADEISHVEEFESLQPVNVSVNEVKLASQLIGNIDSQFNIEQFEDGFRQRLSQLIASKMDKSVSAPAPVKSTAKAPTVDIMSALQNSLKAIPPKKAVQPEAKKSKKKVA